MKRTFVFLAAFTTMFTGSLSAGEESPRVFLSQLHSVMIECSYSGGPENVVLLESEFLRDQGRNFYYFTLTNRYKGPVSVEWDVLDVLRDAGAAYHVDVREPGNKGRGAPSVDPNDYGKVKPLQPISLQPGERKQFIVRSFPQPEEETFVSRVMIRGDGFAVSSTMETLVPPSVAEKLREETARD